jgi:hypothetical protein
VPDYVRAIQHDNSKRQVYRRTVEGAGQFAGIALEGIKDMTPIWGTYRALDRGDYLGGAISLVGDISLIAGAFKYFGSIEIGFELGFGIQSRGRRIMGSRMITERGGRAPYANCGGPNSICELSWGSRNRSIGKYRTGFENELLCESCANDYYKDMPKPRPSY